MCVEVWEGGIVSGHIYIPMLVSMYVGVAEVHECIRLGLGGTHPTSREKGAGCGMIVFPMIVTALLAY